MPRSLRGFLLGCIAIAFAYVLLHAREPLRLNVGDPSSDASVLATIKHVQQDGFFEPPAPGAGRTFHAPPLAELGYSAVGRYLGVGDIATLRLFALACSVLAVVLLFQYARRIWNDTIALLATALFTTSFLWMTYADSLAQVPVLQASGFLALWGLVRAIETRQRRYYAAAFLGAWACYLASYDFWLFLPAAVVFTIHKKLGNPFARGNQHFVVICVAGCVAGMVTSTLFAAGAVGWQELPADPFGRASTALNRKLAAPLPVLLRRYTFLLTPLVWVTLAHTAWRVVRAPSVRSVLTDGVTWMLGVAALALGAFSLRAVSLMFGAQPLLLFASIGSALLIQRLLEGGWLRRALAVAWLVAVPAWSFYFLLSHPRSTLDRDDVATVNAYLAASDRNDFVISNLLAAGPIQVAFERHTLAAIDTPDPTQAPGKMLEVLEAAGTDYVHAVIFTTPDSRFLDRSLALLARSRPLGWVTSWPHVRRSMANGMVGEYDRYVRANLARVGAKQVLHLRTFDVYRIDRAALLDAVGRSIPVVRTIDMGSFGANKHKLLGWSEPKLTEEEGLGVASVDGYAPCANPVIEHRAGEPGSNGCETVPTRAGLKVLDKGWTRSAQLMIRVERACDLRVTLELASPGLLAVSLEDFTAPPCAPDAHVAVVIPRRAVRAGINILTIEKRLSVDKQPGVDKRLGPKGLRADVASITIEPDCSP